MQQITTKQALDIMFDKKGTTIYMSKEGFNSLTDDRISRQIDITREELCDYRLHEFKAYRNGYERICDTINEYIDSLDDYTIYSYENEHATMLFLTNTSNTVIINTFFK